MPPRHGKSQLSSIYFPAWYLGRNPDKEIITTSYSGELAKKFGGDTRDIVSDRQYQTIFQLKLKEDSQAKNLWMTEEGGSYTSVGRGGTITGRGADILLIDDPVANREEAESKTLRDGIWDWYTSTAYTRLEKGAAIIVVMTRWHTDDLVGRILAKSHETKEEWTVISFPAIAEEDEEFRQKGEVLWEEKKSKEELMIIKQNNLYDWHALYQQNPVAAETQDFQQSWFKYVSEEELQQKDLYYYTMVDLASEGADNTAIITIGKDKNKPEIYVVDVHAGHLDPGETVEYLFFLKNLYGHRFMRVGIEDVAYQRTLQYWIREEQKKREVYFDVVGLKAKGNKELRIRGLIPMYRAGILYHKQGQMELEEELLMFPKAKHDDRSDALAYCQQILEQTNYKEKQSYIPNWQRGYSR